ncbi:MAG: hypothetical protein AAGA03_10135 [Planctomycetota bacterium]
MPTVATTFNRSEAEVGVSGDEFDLVASPQPAQAKNQQASQQTRFRLVKRLEVNMSRSGQAEGQSWVGGGSAGTKSRPKFSIG